MKENYKIENLVTQYENQLFKSFFEKYFLFEFLLKCQKERIFFKNSTEQYNVCVYTNSCCSKTG
jgi:hypothetical protein